MFVPGNILHGTFDLGSEKKTKYAIVLYNDGTDCILTTFTTSQERSTVLSPCHGRNPSDGEAETYVFKSNIHIGLKPQDSTPFSFIKDTTVVPDYGFTYSSTESFMKNVDHLKVVCHLYDKEYADLIYTLYKCKRLPKKYKQIFECILSDMYK